MGKDAEYKMFVGEGWSKDKDIIIETNMYSLSKGMKNKENNNFIINSNIIFDNLIKSTPDNYKGTYKIGSFKITINNLINCNHKHLDNQQYLFDISKFIFK